MPEASLVLVYFVIGSVIGVKFSRWQHTYLNEHIINKSVDGIDIVMGGFLVVLIALVWPLAVGSWLVGKLVMIGVE